MKKQHTFFLTAAFATTVLAISSIGCGSDPNGSTATGGSGAGGRGGGGGGGTPPTLGAIVGTPVATFDNDAGPVPFTFTINTYASPANLGAAGSPTAAMITLAWDGTEGSPTPGSLKATVPFSDWNQWVEVQTTTQMPLLNWTGKKLHVRMKVASGFGSDPFALSGAHALVNTTSSYVQVNTDQTIPLGNGWQEFIVDANPAVPPLGYDASMVITFGLQIYTGQGNLTAPKPTAAVFYVDSFSTE